MLSEKISFPVSMRALSICAAAAFGVVLLAACGDKSETGGGAGGGAGGATSASSGGSDCGMSFCGCSAAVTLAFAANVLNGQSGDPVEGIELYCDKEASPIAVSDAMGKVAFSIETMESPGCGPERCLSLRFHDPSGPLADTTGTYYQHNGKDVVMQYKPD